MQFDSGSLSDYTSRNFCNVGPSLYCCVPEIIYNRLWVSTLSAARHSREGRSPDPLSFLDSRLRGCVIIDRTRPNSVFVIPGLIRNPVLYQSITLLDAGSSPAWRAEFKCLFGLRHSLLRGNDNRQFYHLNSNGLFLQILYKLFARYDAKLKFYTNIVWIKAMSNMLNS